MGESLTCEQENGSPNDSAIRKGSEVISQRRFLLCTF